MSDAAQTLQLFDRALPGLAAGTYTIEAEHTLAVAGAQIPSAPLRFTVKGPRFTLDPSEIHAVYPPANTSGDYGEVFPHVVLTTRTLPWERKLSGQGETVPWLTLLVLDAAEVAAASAVSPTGTTTMSIKDIAQGGGPTLFVPALGVVSDEEGKLACATLTMGAKLFVEITPRLGELSYLAHVRQIDVSAQPGADAADAGWFADVVANRLPSSTGGAKTIVHLVSLEGQETLLAEDPDSLGDDVQVRLVSLASWTFSTKAESGDDESFAQLASGLAQPRQGERNDLALGLPFEDASKLPAGDPNRVVSERLEAGYVPVGYHLPTGENTFAWYRGPLAALQSGPIAQAALPFPSSSAALVYDQPTGLFDISLATAWELARAMALADRKYTVELVRLRRSAHRVVDLVLAYLQSAHIGTKDDLTKIATSGLIEQRFMDVLGDGLIATVATMSTGWTTVQASTSNGNAGLPTDPVAAVNVLLQRDDVQAVVAEAVADDLEPITRWLLPLTLLQGVPFAYLVPHPRLLPVESIRFFTIDPNWIAALIDGALSPGVQSSRDSWFQQHIPASGSIQPYASTVTGLLLRSAIVSGWPGLTAEAGTVQGQDAEQPSKLLRSDRLAPNVLLCLFEGTPNRIRLRLPHQSLHFALEGGSVHLRSLSAPLGTQTGTSVDAVWRSGAERVLNILAPKPAGKGSASEDLISRIVGKEGLNLASTATFGPADFALQMLAAPEELSFAL